MVSRMSMARVAAIVVAVLLSWPVPMPAATAMGRRAQCRKLCVDALAHCRDADAHKRCRRQIRAQCLQDGPEIVCRPNYTGSWRFTPTGPLTDSCDLAAGPHLEALTTMVVREATWGDSIE